MICTDESKKKKVLYLTAIGILAILIATVFVSTNIAEKKNSIIQANAIYKEALVLYNRAEYDKVIKKVDEMDFAKRTKLPSDIYLKLERMALDSKNNLNEIEKKKKIEGEKKAAENSVENFIKQKKIRLGMTTEQVIQSWGKPKDINRSVGSYGVHEQWVYGDRYVYFEDGILTSWQD